MARRHGEGRGGGLLIAVSLVFVAACAAVLFAVSTGALGPAAAPVGETDEQPLPAKWPDCSWDDLSSAATEISAAPDDASARAIASERGLIDEDGKLSGLSKQLVLSNGEAVACRVVGIRADDLADGSGKAGITFLAGPVAARPMNPQATNSGGWEASGLRSWLGDEGMALLPSELSGKVRQVSKLTNNAGATKDPVGSVTATADFLWVPSGSEVFGDLTWFAQEYGDDPIWNTAYTDFKPYDEGISSECAQYELFAEGGVADREDPQGTVASFLGKMSRNWWLRTPYPVSFIAGDDALFYQVMASGYPSSLASADAENGVVVGFCL